MKEFIIIILNVLSREFGCKSDICACVCVVVRHALMHLVVYHTSHHGIVYCWLLLKWTYIRSYGSAGTVHAISFTVDAVISAAGGHEAR